MWLVGPAQGVGKGLLCGVLQRLVGQANAKVVSAEEFKGEWTDFLTNNSLMILDEVDFESRQDANNKLKRLVGNDRIAVRKRHLGEYEVPAVANFLFTTNNVRPIALDRGDRRNTLFETNGSAESKSRAAQFYRLSSDQKTSAIEGFAQVLASIQIDDDLLSRAFVTDIKQRMIDSGTTPFIEWFHSDETLNRWNVGEFAPIEWIRKNYIAWAKDMAPRSCANSGYVNSRLDELVSEGYLSQKGRKRLHDDSRPHGFVRYDPSSETPQPDAASSEVIQTFRRLHHSLNAGSDLSAIRREQSVVTKIAASKECGGKDESCDRIGFVVCFCHLNAFLRKLREGFISLWCSHIYQVGSATRRGRWA